MSAVTAAFAESGHRRPPGHAGVTEQSAAVLALKAENAPRASVRLPGAS
jgi:hypothetical protein